ncbi:MAG: hypothetical protein LBQ54_03875 [Planctomycetaceae bacterium]|nr:hypothetical protein [Planctomycetaceae bacterium]
MERFLQLTPTTPKVSGGYRPPRRRCPPDIRQIRIAAPQFALFGRKKAVIPSQPAQTARQKGAVSEKSA